MDVLIVNPDHGNKMNFPWGAFSVASYLKTQRGVDVDLIDASIHGEADTLDHIRRCLPDVPLIGLAMFSSDAPFVKKAADLIKSEKPDCTVIVGGPHAVLHPEQTARYQNIDLVAYSGGEETMYRVLQEVNKDKPNFAAVPGVVYEEGGEIHRTAAPPSIPHFDMCYELLDERLQKRLHNYIQVLTGRGCNSRCTFCYNSIIDQKWIGRDMTAIMDEISAIVEKYNPKTIYFRDENFFQGGRERAIEFIRQYKERGFSFKWRATCRANYFNDRVLDPELVKDLAGAGCVCLKIGFESGSQKVLKSLRKGIRIRDIENAVDTLVKVPEIKPVFSFLIGVPGEKREDMEDTLSLCASILDRDPDANIIGPLYFRVYPGGELYDTILKDYDFSVPQTFEEWVDHYVEEERSSHFFNKRSDYPWLHRNSRFLAQNAGDFIGLIAKRYYGRLPEHKKLFLAPFRAMLRWRMKHKFYTAPIDFWIARTVREYSLVRLINRLLRHIRISGDRYVPRWLGGGTILAKERSISEA